MWPDKDCPDQSARSVLSQCASFVFILKMLSVFACTFVGICLPCAVGSQVSEFMRHPVSEGVITHISVAVNEHAPAWEMREHGTRIASGHMELEDSGGVEVLPVRHKKDSQRINVGVA